MLENVGVVTMVQTQTRTGTDTVDTIAQAAKRGSKEARGQLWELVQRVCYLVANRYTANKKLPNDVEMADVYQACYFGMLNALEAYKPNGGYRFTTYLTKHVMHAVRDTITHGHRRAEPEPCSLDEPLTDEEEASLIDTIADEQAELNITGTAELNDLQRLVRREVSTLTEPYRAVVERYYFHGISLTEQAQLYNVSVTMVSTWHRKALQLLRANPCLIDLYGETAAARTGAGSCYSVDPLEYILRQSSRERAPW